MAHETVLRDGSFDFSGGVDSQAVTTIRSELVPHGLRRDQLAWLSNATVRGGGILQRTGWSFLLNLLPKNSLWQGGFIYAPPDDTSPFLVCAVSGRIFKVLLEAPFTVTDLSTKFGGLVMPSTVLQCYFVQAELFLIIQAGDAVTKPLFYFSDYWNGTTIVPENMRRSNGLTNLVATSELPPATMMCYYAGRVWYAQGRTYTAGDIVDGPSGTTQFNNNDSVLKVTENPLAFGGDGFRVPTQAGNIRALTYTANLDTALGQGPLYIFTRKQVYALNVPVSRTDWIAATSSKQPLQTVAQINNGAAGESGIVHVNGDLFYQSIDPAIRSLIVATRYYDQWGNVPISNNVVRALQFNDRSLMKFSSGILFDNRLLQGILPLQTASGVVSKGILPLDFDIISTMQERQPPAWEGMWQGVDPLQLFTGDFGGRQRAFAVIVSREDASLDVWELSDSLRFENGDDPKTSVRVQWYAEFPAFDWSKLFELKELVGGEIWVDKVFGQVNMTVEYRPDADPCWHPWLETSFCAARNCDEDVDHPVCYPLSPNYREGAKFPIGLPRPKAVCGRFDRRPSNIGYQFQPKITVTGWCRIRGIILFAAPKGTGVYENLAC